MGKPYQDEEVDELEADSGIEEEEEESEAEETAAESSGSGGSAGGTAAPAEFVDERTVASRQAVRDEMERQVAEFLARGGRIQQIDPNVTADPPRKPDSEYGSRPI
jgi:hypothetical protein